MKKTKREAKATSLFLQKTIKKLLQKGRASVANSSARLKKNLVLPAAKGPGAKVSICEIEGIFKYAELFWDQRNEKTFYAIFI